MYEFSQSENATIRNAAGWAKGLAIIFFLQALFALCGFKIIDIIINLVIGIYFHKASNALTLVVTTEGDDVKHMMDALTELKTAFTIRIVLFCIAVILGLIVLLYVLMNGPESLGSLLSG